MTDPVRTLIDELIESQRRLDTPVVRASALREEIINDQSSIINLRTLIPLTAPGPGEQYAFQVDLDSCTGCKACVSGCHSLNGLDEHETWRDVGLILGGTTSVSSEHVSPVGRELARAPNHSGFRTPSVGRELARAPLAPAYQQTITTACHHCEDPACLAGCPVLAYEKDPITGIVVHLDDQCIGCSYCVLKCPYDVPKYNDRLGIVRKCDMCHGRLAAGEAPACVQSCPTEAITIVTVPIAKSQTPHSKSQTTDTLAAISGTDSSYTHPTTRYVSNKPLPANLRAADSDALRPQHAHHALVLLLVLTQLGLGLIAAAQILNPKSQILNLLGLALYAAGLIASVAHLGQPFRAWRVFLGLRRSWLSREAVLLGSAFPLLVAASASEWLPLPFIAHWSLAIGHSGLAVAAAGIFCSAMIYTDTRRHFWRLSQSLGRMAGTVLVSTLAGLSVATSASEWSGYAALALAAKLALELLTFTDGSVSARLQQGPLRRFWGSRIIIAGLAIAVFAANQVPLGFFFLVIAELLERTLFFRAVDSPKMPGVPSS